MVKFLFLFLILLSSFVFADLQYLAKSVGPHTSFESVGNSWTDAPDDGMKAFDIGFNFPFNGTTYSRVYVSTNAALTFQNNETFPYRNRDVTYIDQSIYPYWDDLNPSVGGTVKYGTVGVGDAEHFIIEWNVVPHYGTGGKYTFQVVLYKNGKIRFRYDSNSDTDGSSATIGVEEDASHYDQHSNDNSSTFDATQDILYRPLVHLSPIIPNCTSPIAKVEMSTYDRSSDNRHAANEYSFETLIQNYATDEHWFGSGYQNNIDGEKNPYGSDHNYLTIFEGYIYLPDSGTYKFGVDGDDAIELYLDDKLITGWYGGHGKHYHEEYAINVDVQAGWHKLEYHQEEINGGNNYYLYWKRPNGNMEKVPASQFFHCSAKVTKTSVVTSDPTNGSSNPKRIPGATIEYRIEATNLGNIRISNAILADTLESNFDWVTDSIKVTSPIVNGSLTDANDGDNGSFNGSRVEVNCDVLKKDEVCLVTFDATIK